MLFCLSLAAGAISSLCFLSDPCCWVYIKFLPEKFLRNQIWKEFCQAQVRLRPTAACETARKAEKEELSYKKFDIDPPAVKLPGRQRADPPAVKLPGRQRADPPALKLQGRQRADPPALKSGLLPEKANCPGIRRTGGTKISPACSGTCISLFSAASPTVFFRVALNSECEDHAEDQSCGDAKHDEAFLLGTADLKVHGRCGSGYFLAACCQVLLHLSQQRLMVIPWQQEEKREKHWELVLLLLSLAV